MKKLIAFISIVAIIAGAVLLYASTQKNSAPGQGDFKNKHLEINDTINATKLNEQCPKPIQLVQKSGKEDRVLLEHAYPSGIEVVYLNILPISYPVDYQYKIMSKEEWIDITQKLADRQKVFFTKIEHYTRHDDYENKLYNLLVADALLPLIKEAVTDNVLHCISNAEHSRLPEIVIVKNPLHTAVNEQNALTISVGVSLETLSGGDPFRPNIWKAIRIRAYQYTPNWQTYLKTVPSHPRYQNQPSYYYLEGTEYLSRPHSHFIGTYATSDQYPIPIDSPDALKDLIKQLFKTDLFFVINLNH